MAKKFNLKKTVNKATKAAAPATKAVAKATAPATKAVAKAAEPAAKTVAKAAAPVVKPVAKAAAPVLKAAAPAAGAAGNKLSQQLKECNKKSEIQKSEITNLKFSLESANNDKKLYLDQIKSKNQELESSKQQIDNLNKNVSILTNRIEAPLVRVEGFATTTQVNRNDPLIIYDISKSGLQATADAYGQLYGAYFQGYQETETMLRDEAIPEIEYLSTTDLNGLMYAYTAVQQQNKTLESQIESTSDEYSTDFQKAKYANDSLESTKKINAILFFGFYILVFVFAYVVFTNASLGINIPMKTIVIVVAFLYPYWIGYIWRFIMFLSKYISALIHGTPYESSVSA